MEKKSTLILSDEQIAYLRDKPVVGNDETPTDEKEWRKNAKINAESAAKMAQGAVEALMTGYDSRRCTK